MRWRLELSYFGKAYCGWQKQPGDLTVQQALEEAFSMILREPIEITGCGRTDTGVHARHFTAHMDVASAIYSPKMLYQINAVLPLDIAIHSITETDYSFHARHSAIERHYQYYIHFEKNPFNQDQSFYFNQNTELDMVAMQETAILLKEYSEFLPFCKTGSGAEHYKCTVTESHWIFDDHKATFSIKANRFLRGMVRLIVGACLNAGLGKLSVNDVKECLDKQIPLPVQWSVPPEGLFLENVVYP
ncbi:MAG TPA: tRNA pseudouridine(38-40) synthase TruA [Saprospiraceae bacterium]|nr:tRNA pseudouridine(38-40) synthase TruA [Saprospiraceae bacterium]